MYVREISYRTFGGVIRRSRGCGGVTSSGVVTNHNNKRTDNGARREMTAMDDDGGDGPYWNNNIKDRRPSTSGEPASEKHSSE